MLETLLNYLPAKDRKKTQRKVDKLLDETYKIPQDDEDWSKYLNDIFWIFQNYLSSKSYGAFTLAEVKVRQAAFLPVLNAPLMSNAILSFLWW
jgi:hypothetical protein